MAGEAPKYAAWVRTLPCRMRDADGSACSGWVEAHHAGPKGMSQRAHDNTCVPLCHYHHMAWHAASGPFRPMDKAARRQWAEDQITNTRALAPAHWLQAAGLP